MQLFRTESRDQGYMDLALRSHGLVVTEATCGARGPGFDSSSLQLFLPPQIQDGSNLMNSDVFNYDSGCPK